MHIEISSIKVLSSPNDESSCGCTLALMAVLIMVLIMMVMNISGDVDTVAADQLNQQGLCGDGGSLMRLVIPL